jgi:hypothetical protein
VKPAAAAREGPASGPRRGLDWLAFDRRPFLGAVAGAALGAGVYARLLPGHEAPWVVGLGLGLGTAALARDRSVIRGLVLGALALWASALAQAAWLPRAGAGSFLGEVGRFHETLDLPRLVGHAVGGLAAGWLAARSFTARTRRVAGA